jgi:RNA polymerase sigma factor (sigma-70 family)
VAQEVLASAISQIERGIYRGKARLGTWLEPIIRGKVAEYKRASGRRVISAARPPEVVPGELAKVPKELVSLPEQETRVLVHEVLRSLRTQHRVVLILNKVGNLSIAQISQRLGWPKGTVGRLLAEAQKLFRRGIAGREEFPTCTRQRIGSGEE